MHGRGESGKNCNERRMFKEGGYLLKPFYVFRVWKDHRWPLCCGNQRVRMTVWCRGRVLLDSFWMQVYASICVVFKCHTHTHTYRSQFTLRCLKLLVTITIEIIQNLYISLRTVVK